MNIQKARVVNSLALSNTQLNLKKVYKDFFGDKSVGFPRFKSKKLNKYDIMVMLMIFGYTESHRRWRC